MGIAEDTSGLKPRSDGDENAWEIQSILVQKEYISDSFVFVIIIMIKRMAGGWMGNAVVGARV